MRGSGLEPGPTKKQKSLTVRANASEVIIGLMSATLERGRPAE